MNALLARLLKALPFEARGLRAIDETLADWTEERHRVTGMFRRAVVDAQSLVSLLRVVVVAAVTDITHVPFAWLTTRTSLVLIAPAVLLALTGWGHMPAAPAAEWQQLLLTRRLLFPQAVVALLPCALFLVVACAGRRSVPIVGLSLAAMIAVLAISAWVLPIASRHVHVLEYATRAHLTLDEAAARLPFGPGDLLPGALLNHVADRPVSPYAGVLAFRAASVALIPAFVMFGGLVATLSTLRRRVSIALVVTIYAVAIAALPSSWELGGHTGPFSAVFVWALAALPLALSRMMRGSDPQPLTIAQAFQGKQAGESSAART